MPLIKAKPVYQFWNYRNTKKQKLTELVPPQLSDLSGPPEGEPKTVRGLISHHILLPHKELPRALIDRLKIDLTLRNPEFIKAMKYGKGFVSYSIPEFVHMYSMDSQYMGLPRSVKIDYLQRRFRECNLILELEDTRPQFESVTFPEKGVINPYFYQRDAISHILEGNVVIKLKCGRGKTVLALMAVAQYRLRTLILVRTNILMNQWVTAIKQIFDIQDEDIGIIRGKIKREGLITIAMEQTISNMSREEKRRIGNTYGHIIHDECLAYDTTVLTDRGPKYIGDLVKEFNSHKNLSVLSYNEKTKEKEYKKVISGSSKGVRRIIEIEFNNGKIIRCTPEHPFFVKDKGWVKAMDLAQSDDMKVKSIRYVDESEEVFDIGVEDNHNFFTDCGLVHNCHEVGAKRYQELLQYFKARKVTGLSIGGKSRVLIRKDGKLYVTGIKDIVALKENQIKDVLSKNIFVRCYDEKKGVFIWSKISHVHKYRNTKKTYSVETVRGRNIVLTEDHSIYRIEGDKVKGKKKRGQLRVGGYRAQRFEGKKKIYGKIKTVKGSDLRIGDYLVGEPLLELDSLVDTIDLVDYVDSSFKVSFQGVVQAIDKVKLSECRQLGFKNTLARIKYSWKNSSFGAPVMPVDLFRMKTANAEGTLYRSRNNPCFSKAPVKYLSWFLGFFVGDGCVCSNRIYLFTNKGQKSLVLRKICYLEKFFGAINLDISTKGKGVQIRFSSLVLSQLLLGLFGGAKAGTKRIPSIVFSFSEREKRQFISGMLDSDGHIQSRSRNRVRAVYTSVSEGLAKDLIDLLKFFRVQASLTYRNPSLGGVVGGRRIVGRKKVYTTHFSLNEFRGESRGYLGHYGVDGDVDQLKIKGIKEVEEEFVYDLTVKGVHNFVAEGLLVHNSATPFREDGMTPVLKAYIGQIVEIDDLGEFKTKIRLRRTKFTYDFTGQKGKYHKLIEALIHDTDRNKMIIEDVKEFILQGKIVVCYSNRIEHMEILEQMIRVALPNAKTDILASRKYETQLRVEDQDNIRENLNRKDLDGVFGGKIMEQGFDCPPLEVAIMATPSKSRRLILQVLGRCQREWPGKKEAIFCDYIDEKTKILLYQFFAKNKRIYKDYPKEYVTEESQYNLFNREL